ASSPEKTGHGTKPTVLREGNAGDEPAKVADRRPNRRNARDSRRGSGGFPDGLSGKTLFSRYPAVSPPPAPGKPRSPGRGAEPSAQTGPSPQIPRVEQHQ